MDRKKQLESILVIVIGFLILYVLFKVETFLWIALGVGVLSLISNWVAEKITWLWFKIAEILGYINSRVLLSAIFFLFLTPIAFLSRVFSGKKLNLKRSDDTYYENTEHLYEPKDFEEMW